MRLVICLALSLLSCGHIRPVNGSYDDDRTRQAREQQAVRKEKEVVKRRAYFRNRTAIETGCAPEAVVVANDRNLDGTWFWDATCGTKPYRCSSYGQVREAVNPWNTTVEQQIRCTEVQP